MAHAIKGEHNRGRSDPHTFPASHPKNRIPLQPLTSISSRKSAHNKKIDRVQRNNKFSKIPADKIIEKSSQLSWQSFRKRRIIIEHPFVSPCTFGLNQPMLTSFTVPTGEVFTILPLAPIKADTLTTF
jgi:hypothetical protein